MKVTGFAVKIKTNIFVVNIVNRTIKKKKVTTTTTKKKQHKEHINLSAHIYTYTDTHIIYVAHGKSQMIYFRDFFFWNFNKLLIKS